MNLFNLSNKVAVITGGTGVLGGCAANSLAAAGVHIILIGRNAEAIEDKIKAIEDLGGNAEGYAANVLDKNSLEAVKDKILAKHKTIDILINAAGGNMPGATIGEQQSIFDLNMDDFSKVTDLNLNGTVVPSLVFGAVMANQKSGSIINYSSMTVERAVTRVVGYAASKAAMENFTRWMAVEMATKFGDQIRVNAVAPGFFIGNQNRRLLTNEDGSYTSRGNLIIQNTPMNRFGNAEELNGIIHFLCSDAASFITGTVIPVDGGFSAFSGV